jgi:hypothetical protein
MMRGRESGQRERWHDGRHELAIGELGLFHASTCLSQYLE